MNWKKISSDLVTQHSDTESAVVSLDPHSMGEIVNLSNEDFCLEVKGRELKAKRFEGSYGRTVRSEHFKERTLCFGLLTWKTKINLMWEWGL